MSQQPPILQEENPLLDDAVMQPLVQVFLERLPERVLNMEQALANDDWPLLARYAHQVKGTAASFGYPALTASARELEACLKTADTRQAAKIFQTMKEYVLGRS